MFTMVLILEIGPHIILCYKICLWHVIGSRADPKSDLYYSGKTCFPLCLRNMLLSNISNMMCTLISKSVLDTPKCLGRVAGEGCCLKTTLEVYKYTGPVRGEEGVLCNMF